MLEIAFVPKTAAFSRVEKVCAIFLRQTRGENNFLPVALMIEPANAGLAFPFDRPPLGAVFLWFTGGLVLVFNLL